MPHRDTSVAFNLAITQALNATQGNKCSYKNQAITSALNATQGHGIAFKQAITSALNATEGHKHRNKTSYYFGSKCHTRTQAQLSNKLLLWL